METPGPDPWQQPQHPGPEAEPPATPHDNQTRRDVIPLELEKPKPAAPPDSKPRHRALPRIPRLTRRRTATPPDIELE